MDIGKYIGKFLLKNKYCSLPGLGVFDLKKIHAQINHSSTEVSPPRYLVTFNPIGSIDDTFASFIANFENVSISNASNNIKEYCVMVKEEIAKTGQFEIEHLGKLTMSAGKMVFTQSDDMNLGVEPAPIAPLEIKSASVADDGSGAKKEDYSYPPSRPNMQANANWMKMLIPILLFITLSVLGYLAFQFFKSQSSLTSDETVIENEVQVDTVQKAQMIDTTVTSLTDTTLKTVDTNKLSTTIIDTSKLVPAVVTKPINNGTLYKVAILTFDNEASATKKAEKLKSYGNNTTVMNRNNQYIVINTAAHPTNDTTKLVDSLRKMFNPKGPVYILK
jgi:hypothetical protein